MKEINISGNNACVCVCTVLSLAASHMISLHYLIAHFIVALVSRV